MCIRDSFGYATAPQENNAAYLKHWLTKLKEEPAFLVEILGDVNKAAKMIADKDVYKRQVPYHFLVARWHGWLSATCGKQAC